MSLVGISSWIESQVVDIANQSSWLSSDINSHAINSAVNVCRHRPHPWSTYSDYVSWVTLTDQRYSARHLPAYYPDYQLPDPTQLIQFFARPDETQAFCSKSTVLFPAFAQYLTDGFIRTRMPHGGESQDLRKQNTSNHQIDLSPLYGRTLHQTDLLRLKSEAVGKKGRLKSQIVNGQEYAPFLYRDDGTPDPFYQDLDAPLGIDTVAPADIVSKKIFASGGDRANASPQIAMMNMLFLREHNRLAGQLEKNNPGWDDERCFQIARNILIVLFIKIVVEEYINHISPSEFHLRADPSVAWNAPWNKPNWITTEFSLLYRWHSLIPDTMKWGTNTYETKDTILNNEPLVANGLATSFTDVSSQRAGRLGAFNTDTSLLALELLAINQGRRCQVAPYGDYRNYVGLARPQTFSDVSQNPQVVNFLSTHYGSPDEIEFYIGIFAEDQIPNSPLPLLLFRMVAVDAFSQALTNPLMSEHVFNVETFTKYGWDTIHNTSSLQDILSRNVPEGNLDPNARISMTWDQWTPV
jgi:prostaglandin-endoperoxide synthase 2